MSRAWGVAAVVAGVWLGGCGAHARAVHVTMGVTPSRSLVDAPVRVTVTGLPAHGTATLRAAWRARDGTLWRSSEPVRAAADGRAVITDARWLTSMSRRDGELFLPPTGPSIVRLALTQGGRVVARTALRRREALPTLRARSLSVRRDGLRGIFYTPPSPRGRPAILAIGGSDGATPGGIAALLASHGYPALALDYFTGPGLPRELKRIPLEYFARGLRWLSRRRGVDPRRLVVYGISRGGEGALLIGAMFPKLVHGVIAMVPSNEVEPAFPDHRAPAWTFRAKAMAPTTGIPVERIDGPVLVAGAGEDAVWPSSESALLVELTLRSHHFRFAHRRLDFPHGGHDIGSAVPYLPAAPDRDYWGGTREATAAAHVVLWKAVLAYLRSMSSIR